jgi:hypothetical protein
MVLAILCIGSSQDFFQTARSIAAASAHLATPLVPLGLRLNLGLDNLFSSQAGTAVGTGGSNN